MSGLQAIRQYGKKDVGSFRPQLTSLVDVMTILLVFLIKSFSAEGNLITPAENLQLPQSTSKESVRPMVAIEITSRAILADGVVIAEHATFIGSDSLQIDPLYSWVRAREGKLVKDERNQEVMIQSDRDVAFNVVKRVMYTLSKAGVTNFTVLVVNEEQS